MNFRDAWAIGSNEFRGASSLRRGVSVPKTGGNRKMAQPHGGGNVMDYADISGGPPRYERFCPRDLLRTILLGRGKVSDLRTRCMSDRATQAGT